MIGAFAFNSFKTLSVTAFCLSQSPVASQTFKIKSAFLTLSSVDLKALIKTANPEFEGFYELQEEYGKNLVDKQDYVSAVEILEKLYNYYKKNDVVKSQDPQLLYNLALAYMGIHEYPNAVEMFGKLYAINRHVEIIFGYVEALCGLQMYKDALEVIMANRENMPTDGSTENLLGIVYMGLKNIPEAQRNFYKSLEINDQNSYTYRILGFIYKALGREEESLEAFSKVKYSN